MVLIYTQKQGCYNEYMLKNYFRPNDKKELISDISFDWLDDNHIDLIIIDVDNTIVVKGSNQVDHKTDEWIKECVKRCDNVIICSNNTSSVAYDLSSRYSCFGFNLALKPFKIRLNRFIKQNNIKYTNACIIGDQLFTDIWLGKRFKFKTILVQLLNRQDYGLTKIFRFIEKNLLEEKYGK